MPRTFTFPRAIRPCSASTANCTRVDYPPLENDDLKMMLYEIAPEYKIKDL